MIIEIKKIFNTTKEEIESNKFNIFIGISLGNKWFTKEHLREYLHWTLENTHENILFLIADKIHAINYYIRAKKESKNRSLKKALETGKKFKEVLKGLISELPKEKQSKIKILLWDEYERRDEFYKKSVPIIYNEFENNKQFREEVLYLVSSMINDRKFSNEEYLELVKYLLEEFAISYSGIKLNSKYYGMYIYQQESIFHEFIDKIRRGKIFPKFNKKLPKEKVALAIVN